MPPFQVYEFAFACCSIAAVSLLAWDHIITLRAEVSKMWSKKVSGPSVLYGLLRYGTLVEKIAVMLLASWYITPHIFPMVLRTLAFNAFSALRVYALMGNKFPLAIFVLLLCLPSLITPAYVYAHDWSTGVDVYGCQLSYLASQPVHDRCAYPAFTVSELRISGILADLLAEIIVLCVTFRKTFHLRGNIPTDGQGKLPTLSALILRDGTIYFVALLVLSLADMLVLIFDHVPQSVVGYDYWVVPYYTPVFRAIIICRFLLSLRTIHQGEEEDDNEKSKIGSLHFASRVVGSLGAPLEANGIRFADGTSSEDYDEDDDIIYSRDPFTRGMLSAANSSTDNEGKEIELESRSSVNNGEHQQSLSAGEEV